MLRLGRLLVHTYIRLDLEIFQMTESCASILICIEGISVISIVALYVFTVYSIEGKLVIYQLAPHPLCAHIYAHT